MEGSSNIKCLKTRFTADFLICSGLEKLALTAQAAKKKHLQRVQLMKAQTYQNADIVQQRREKDRADEVHTQTVEARQAQLKAERLAREANVEVQLQNHHLPCLCSRNGPLLSPSCPFIPIALLGYRRMRNSVIPEQSIRDGRFLTARFAPHLFIGAHSKIRTTILHSPWTCISKGHYPEQLEGSECQSYGNRQATSFLRTSRMQAATPSLSPTASSEPSPTSSPSHIFKVQEYGAAQFVTYSTH